MMEIERKFLVKNDSYRKNAVVEFIRQGYISSDVKKVVRVRIAENVAQLCIKSMVSQLSRLEYEYRIPIAEAKEILDNICQKPLIEKYRYTVRDGSDTWIVDEFIGENEGLIVAEIELESENQEIKLPEWIGKEVSGDTRYLNANLIKHPYQQWKNSEINDVI